jgi:hypothetical protein
MSRTYDFGASRLGVRTTSASFGESLDRALAGYRVPDEEPATYSIVVDGGANGERRSTRGFHILYWGTTALIRTLHLGTLIRGLLTELDATSFAERNDSIYVRAAMLRAAGKTVLAPWWVGSYLGDLGRRVERAGLELPGSTWVAVDRDSAQVVPLARGLKIDERPLRALDGDGSADDRHFVEERTPVDVVCTYVDGSTVMQPLTRGLTLHHLAAAVGNLDEVRGEGIEGLGRMVARARCFGIGVSSPREMLDSLLLALRAPIATKQEPSVVGR